MKESKYKKELAEFDVEKAYKTEEVMGLLAFSITISATATCLVAGSSKVDEITSPFTDLCISVTSSGLSSTSKTIKKHSG